MSNKKILIIVPAYNEEGNIAQTIKEILSLKLPLTVVVINDGSLDATAEEARKFKVNVISLAYNLGIGAAVQTGFKFALKEDFDIAVQVDGDGQHDVAFLEKLIEPIKNDDADIVVGSRFLAPFLGYQSSFIRRFGIHFFARLISFLVGFRITDPTSGFRAYNKKIIKSFAMDYPNDYPEPEAIVMARRFNARLVEIPVQMRKRQSGYSSIRYLRTLYYMIKVTFAVLLTMLRKAR